jgi:catechol 2,3-dioxygenase-like lactoylglutathione lyase family enzyme
MSRLQLALNVSDLDEAISFYSKLFGTVPAKVKPDYANFAIADPPLKLVLFEGAGKPGELNHLGVEVASTAEVNDAQSRLRESGVDATAESNTECCFALQDKVWIDGPDGRAWEIYAVLDDVDSTPPCCGT